MQTELTYRYKNQIHREVLNVRNPSNAGAVFRILHPNYDFSRFEVINAVGWCHGSVRVDFVNSLLRGL